MELTSVWERGREKLFAEQMAASAPGQRGVGEIKTIYAGRKRKQKTFAKRGKVTVGLFQNANIT